VRQKLAHLPRLRVAQHFLDCRHREMSPNLVSEVRLTPAHPGDMVRAMRRRIPHREAP
jgi:hypothetical protein